MCSGAVQQREARRMMKAQKVSMFVHYNGMLGKRNTKLQIVCVIAFIEIYIQCGEKLSHF